MDLNSVDMQHGTDVEMDAIIATQTKPLNNNNFKKRVGAEMTEKLELAENAEYVLSQAEVITYNSLTARCNYLSQDRPDISYAFKRLSRNFQSRQQTISGNSREW